MTITEIINAILEHGMMNQDYTHGFEWRVALGRLNGHVRTHEDRSPIIRRVIDGKVTFLSREKYELPLFIHMRKGDIPRTTKTLRGYIVESVYPIKTSKGFFVPRGTGINLSAAVNSYNKNFL